MSAVERVKLRMKIGVHEFEAEGPRELVLAQLDTWMRVAGLATARAGAPPDGPLQHAAGRPLDATDDPTLRNLFRLDGERKLVVLRVNLTGRRRNADAAILLLHGFDLYLGAGDGSETPAVRLRAAMAASGYRVQRVDRALAPYIAAGLIRKTGSHKHETYSLSAPGTRRAAGLARHFAPAQDRPAEAPPTSDPSRTAPISATTTAGSSG